MGLGLLLKYFKAALIKLNWLNFKTKEEDNIMKKMILIIISLLLFGATVFNQALAAKSEKVLTWSVQSSEAYDAIAFMYAISEIEMYSNCYPNLRAKWKDRLKEDELALHDQLSKSISTSCLSYLLRYAKVKTLDDIIKVISNFAKYQKIIEKELLYDDPKKENITYWEVLRRINEDQKLYLQWFEILKKRGFHEEWENFIEVMLEINAQDMLRGLSKYNLKEIQQIISKILLKDCKPAGTEIYLSWYTEPNAFRLPQGGMVNPGRYYNIKQTVITSIHESLHGFPNAAKVVNEIEIVYNNSPSFKKQCDETIFKWNSWFEEPFVVALTAYISETLGYATYEENEACINNYQGGMPLALEVYQALRQEKSELKKDWQGYGAWLLKKIEAKEFVSLN